MALKQLMTQKKIDQRKKLTEGLENKEASVIVRSEELTEAIDQAETDEEIEDVEGEIAELENDQAENATEKKKLEEEVAELEEELEDLNDKAPSNKEPEDQRRDALNKGGNARMAHNKYETQAQILERINQPEASQFYAKVTEAACDKRALSRT